MFQSSRGGIRIGRINGGSLKPTIFLIFYRFPSLWRLDNFSNISFVIEEIL